MTVGTQGKQGVRERTDLFLKILKFSLDLIRLLMEDARIAKESRRDSGQWRLAVG